MCQEYCSSEQTAVSCHHVDTLHRTALRAMGYHAAVLPACVSGPAGQRPAQRRSAGPGGPNRVRSRPTPRGPGAGGLTHQGSGGSAGAGGGGVGFARTGSNGRGSRRGGGSAGGGAGGGPRGNRGPAGAGGHKPPAARGLGRGVNEAAEALLGMGMDYDHHEYDAGLGGPQPGADMVCVGRLPAIHHSWYCCLPAMLLVFSV